MRWWRLLSAFLIATVLTGLFWPGHGGDPSDPLSGLIQDTFHVPGFFVLTLSLASFWPATVSGDRRAFHLMLAALFLAFLTEGIQMFIGRNASLKDIMWDLTGALLAILGLRLLLKGPSRPQVVRYLLLCVAGVLASFSPVAQHLLLRQRHAARFPELGDFSTRTTLPFWQPESETKSTAVQLRATASAAEASPPEFWLKLETPPGNYRSVHYLPTVQDWSGYQFLVFSTENPGDPFELGLRVDDAASSGHDDRYNGSLRVPTGKETFRIPLRLIEAGPQDRSLDLSQVQRLTFFTGIQQPARIFYLSSVRLTNQPPE